MNAFNQFAAITKNVNYAPPPPPPASLFTATSSTVTNAPGGLTSQYIAADQSLNTICLYSFSNNYSSVDYINIGKRANSTTKTYTWKNYFTTIQAAAALQSSSVSNVGGIGISPEGNVVAIATGNGQCPVYGVINGTVDYSWNAMGISPTTGTNNFYNGGGQTTCVSSNGRVIAFGGSSNSFNVSFSCLVVAVTTTVPPPINYSSSTYTFKFYGYNTWGTPNTSAFYGLSISSDGSKIVGCSITCNFLSISPNGSWNDTITHISLTNQYKIWNNSAATSNPWVGGQGLVTARISSDGNYVVGILSGTTNKFVLLRITGTSVSFINVGNIFGPTRPLGGTVWSDVAVTNGATAIFAISARGDNSSCIFIGVSGYQLDGYNATGNSSNTTDVSDTQSYTWYSQYPNVTSYSSGWIKPLLSQGLPVLGLAVDGTTFISADSTTSNTYYIANHAPI
jgi:hypothetical protein